jgi:hypothetical protein
MSPRPAGYNPLRWDCLERGCFNYKQRPKIERFCGAFPGRIAFSDVDGIVELHGRGLMLEWKSTRMAIPTGQRLMYERLTADGLLTVFVLAGDARTMAVQAMAFFHNGRFHDWCRCDFDTAFARMHRWAAWAESHPWPGPPRLRAV